MILPVPHFTLALPLVLALWLMSAGCQMAPVRSREWPVSASMALAVSTVPVDGGIPLPFGIKSAATTSGGVVTLWPSGVGVRGGNVCSQAVNFAEESLLRSAKWTGSTDYVGRVASKCEERAIVDAFVWLEMRGIHEAEYDVDVSTDAHGSMTVILQCVPYQLGGQYLFQRRANGLCIGP